MFELIPKSHDFGIAREKKQGGIIALSKWSQIQPRGREVSHLYFPLHGLREIRFRSLEAGVQLLSAKNRALLRLIAARHPKSVSELAMLAGRAEQNVLRTLRKLSAAGLVRLDKAMAVPTSQSLQAGKFILRSICSHENLTTALH